MKELAAIEAGAIDVEVPSIFDTIFLSIFDRFGPLSSTPGSLLEPSPLAFSWFFGFIGDIDFPSHFYPNLAPFWFQKSTKIAPKIDPEKHQKFGIF